jgi:hypothetical protein
LLRCCCGSNNSEGFDDTAAPKRHCSLPLPLPTNFAKKVRRTRTLCCAAVAVAIIQNDFNGTAAPKRHCALPLPTKNCPELSIALALFGWYCPFVVASPPAASSAPLFLPIPILRQMTRGLYQQKLYHPTYKIILTSRFGIYETDIWNCPELSITLAVFVWRCPFVVASPPAAPPDSRSDLELMNLSIWNCPVLPIDLAVFN